MNLLRVLENCDQRAEFTYGWRDFTPLGMLIRKDGGVEAIGGAPKEANLRQVILTTGRAARDDFKTLAGIAVLCSAWASKSAPALMLNPREAGDRKRARIIYLADTDYRVWTYTNVEGDVSYEHTDAADCALGGIPEFVGKVLAEATMASWFFCSTGTHERKALL